jgi:hypothetical protein
LAAPGPCLGSHRGSPAWRRSAAQYDRLQHSTTLYRASGIFGIDLNRGCGAAIRIGCVNGARDEGRWSTWNRSSENGRNQNRTATSDSHEVRRFLDADAKGDLKSPFSIFSCHRHAYECRHAPRNGTTHTHALYAYARPQKLRCAPSEFPVDRKAMRLTCTTLHARSPATPGL